MRERFEREYSDPAKRKALEQRGTAALGRMGNGESHCDYR
jgi:hypothetical protein